MKKGVTLLLCVCFSTMLMAQRNTLPNNSGTLTKHQISLEKFLFQPKGTTATYFLTNRNSTDMYEQKEFVYNNQQRVSVINDDNYIYNEKVIDSISYNAAGLVSRIDGYQLLNGTWKHVYYLLYSYNDDGQMTQRLNFNSGATSTFEQGGVYDFNYNQGRLVSHTCYFGNHSTLIETCSYHYNSQNQLVEEKYLQGYGSVDTSFKFVYCYDANGRIISKTLYYYMFPGWDLGETEVFAYDQYGNCTDHSILDNIGEYAERRLYEYNLYYDRNDISMPFYIPELGYPETLDYSNMRYLEHWYGRDENMVLQHICDYEYLYNNRYLSVTANDENEDMLIYPNPAEHVMNITVTEKHGAVLSADMYDIHGKSCQKLVLNQGNNNIGIDLLQSGMYFISIHFTDGTTVGSKCIIR